MGCTPSKPSKPPQKQISRPMHPQPTTKKSTHPSTRRTLYQSPHHAPRPASEKARMNTKTLPLLPPKAELRSKGQLDPHGKIIINPHPTWNGKKTMPRPYPGQVIKRKPVPSSKPAIPVKASGHAARAMHVQQQQQRKAVPREIKRVAANHHPQKVAFLDGKWVGPENGKNAFTGFRGGYMVQRYDGKWVPAKEVMRGKGGREREVVHAGGWF